MDIKKLTYMKKKNGKYDIMTIGDTFAIGVIRKGNRKKLLKKEDTNVW